MNVVENGNCMQVYEDNEPIPKGLWTNNQKQRHFLNSKARNSLMCALSEHEYSNIHVFKGTKMMWNTITITYGNFIKVKIIS